MNKPFTSCIGCGIDWPHSKNHEITKIEVRKNGEVLVAGICWAEHEARKQQSEYERQRDKAYLRDASST